MLIPNSRRDEVFKIDKSLFIDCHIKIITTIANILNVYYVPDIILSTL